MATFDFNMLRAIIGDDATMNVIRNGDLLPSISNTMTDIDDIYNVDKTVINDSRVMQDIIKSTKNMNKLHKFPKYYNGIDAFWDIDVLKEYLLAVSEIVGEEYLQYTINSDVVKITALKPKRFSIPLIAYNKISDYTGNYDLAIPSNYGTESWTFPHNIHGNLRISGNFKKAMNEFSVDGEVEIINCSVDNTHFLPKHIGGKYLSFENCQNIQKIENITDDFYGTLILSDNTSMSTVECPKNISDLYIMSCNSLENIKNIPKHLTGDLTVNNCPVKSIDWLPQKVDGDVNISNIGIYLSNDDIRNICDIGGFLYLNGELI